jgi:hypothetical protein
MKRFLVFILSSVLLVGCSDPEGVLYDDSQAYVSFKETVYDLKVPVNSSKVLDVEFVASNKVSYDRTYQVTRLDEETDANQATYSFPSTFTKPANSYTGVLQITGSDLGLVDSTVKKLTLILSGLAENERTDNNKLVINIFEFCPIVVDEFVGDFSSNTWWAGPAVNYVFEGDNENVLVIEDFFSDDAENPNFEFTFDPEDNNNITFETRNTGFYSNANGGYVWARMSTVASNVSYVDACTGKINVWIEYYIPGVGTWGPQLEVFTKL